MSNQLEYFSKLKLLLDLEKKSEQEQFTNLLKAKSIDELVSQGYAWFPLQIEESGYGFGDYPYIVVKRNNRLNIEHKFDGGKSIALFSAQKELKDAVIKGSIYYVSEHRMKLVFQCNELPDWVDDGKLGVKLLFDETSYKEMELALKKMITLDIESEQFQRNEILLGFKESALENKVDYLFSDNLNESQNRAVKKCLQSNTVTLVHGPPGTGKTTTLVKAIQELLKVEKQILVCTPSNASADFILEKIIQSGIYAVRVGNPSRINPEVLDHCVESKISKHSEYKRVKEYSKRAQEMRSMANKYKRNFGFSEREQRRLLLKEAKSLMSEAIDLENYLALEIINNAEVIVSTLVGSQNRLLQNKLFETVVIDEAAQAIEPACWIVIQKGKRVIMAGDPLQLPPTLKAKENLDSGLSITLMEKLLKFQPNSILLEVQYRMNDLIMQFSNNQFYSGKLRSHQTVKNQQVLCINNHPFEFIDTAGCGYEEQLNETTQSYYNTEEAVLIQKHLDELINELGEHLYIGIISPYREQVRFLNEFINCNSEFVHLNINTIDSFQGQECDVIYISLVRSNDQGEIGFLRDKKRLNVAMTRAKKKMIIIGDSATIAVNELYSQLIDFVQEQCLYRSAWEFN